MPLALGRVMNRGWVRFPRIVRGADFDLELELAPVFVLFSVALFLNINPSWRQSLFLLAIWKSWNSVAFLVFGFGSERYF